MAITSNDCKKAIVNWIKSHPGHVSKQFDPPEQEISAQDEKNWKRMYRRKCTHVDTMVNPILKLGMWERAFDCKPYDDQLRAYTYDDENKIVYIVVQGE